MGVSCFGPHSAGGSGMPIDAVEVERQTLRVIEVARAAGARGDGPYGATLVANDGEVLAEAGNTEITDNDCTAHAETNIVRSLMRAGKLDQLRAGTLYASSEPCTMCCTNMYRAGLRRCVYALRASPVADAPAGTRGSLLLGNIHEIMARGNKQVCEVVHAGETLEAKAREVVEQFNPAYPEVAWELTGQDSGFAARGSVELP